MGGQEAAVLLFFDKIREHRCNLNVVHCSLSDPPDNEEEMKLDAAQPGSVAARRLTGAVRRCSRRYAEH